MRPSEFDYLSPNKLEDAVSLVSRHKQDCKILAGGQSLVPMMKFRLLKPKYVIDLGMIPNLDYVRTDQVGNTLLGCLVTHSTVIGSSPIRENYPMLWDSAKVVGDRQVQNRGTVAGAVCHSDPGGDYCSSMMALEAQFKTVSAGGTRLIPAGDFFQGVFTTSLKDDEILYEIVLPRSNARVGQAYVKFSRRSGDFAIIGAAALLSMDENGFCGRARLFINGLETSPVREVAAERALEGHIVNKELIETASMLVGESALNPLSDIWATGEYRRAISKEFAKRALLKSLDRSRRHVDGQEIEGK